MGADRPDGAAPPAQTRSERVLVVDDDPHVTFAVAAALRAWGVCAVQTPDAAAALLGAGGDFGLVLCDLNLDGESGLVFADRLLAERPGLAGRIVLMSGFFSPAEQRELEARGIEAYQKPGSLRGLRELAQRYLGAA